MERFVTTTVRVRRFLRNDPSALSLIVSNAITIVVAIVQGWDPAVLMLIYWGQSVIIGLANFVRILSLRKFSTKGMTINNRPVAPTDKVRRQTAFFFLCHYGFFHLIYFLFIAGSAKLEWRAIGPIILCLILFLANHTFSLFHNLRRDLSRKPNIGSVMFFPYARIIPLHLTIIFGSIMGRGTGKMILFLTLKTLADLIMHGVEHTRGARPEETVSCKV